MVISGTVCPVLAAIEALSRRGILCILGHLQGSLLSMLAVGLLVTQPLRNVFSVCDEQNRI